MGIINTIKRSSDDLANPQHKSYWGYDLEVQLVDCKEITEERALAHELSGREPIEDVIVLSNSNDTLGQLTAQQVRDILDDMGFNVDTIMSGAHFADFSAVMNIGGYAIPGWVYFARNIAKLFPSTEKLLLLKLAPGKDRLHIRIFTMQDGRWLIAAHTDHNWMSLNLSRVYRAHFHSGKPVGSGDYITGTLMIYNLFQCFIRSVNANQVIKYVDIEREIARTYNQSLAQKVNKSISLVQEFVKRGK